MTDKVYGRHPKPDAWPCELLRRVTLPNKEQYVESLCHGIWGLDPASKVDVVVKSVTKGRLREHDERVWGETLDQVISKLDQVISNRNGARIAALVETREMALFLQSTDLGAIADGKWDGVSFGVVSKTTFRVHGEVFIWVQKSGAVIDYSTYPGPKSVVWHLPAHNLFVKAVAANRQYEQYISELRSFDKTMLSVHGIPERIDPTYRWIDSVRMAAQDAIKERADKEKQKAEAEKREREEQERRERERQEAEQRRLIEEQRRKDEEAKKLANKPLHELSAEEFAERMRLKREQQEKANDSRT